MGVRIAVDNEPHKNQGSVFSMDRAMAELGARYCVPVENEDLAEHGLCMGDIVYVRPGPGAKPGKPAIVRIAAVSNIALAPIEPTEDVAVVGTIVGIGRIDLGF